MNTKKSENRILWICLAAALALTAAYFIVAALYRRSAQPEAAATAPTLAENVALPEAGNQAKPDATSDLDQVKVTLSDYYVFKLDGLDFNFVIAKIHVKGNTPINITLDHFKTSEGTTLDSVDSYVAKLEENSLFLGKQNVWFSLISQNSEYDANIFIPVIDKNAASISVAVDFGGNADLGFDLSKKAGSAEMLQYQADDVITDGKSYQMTVSAAYDITGGYMDTDEETEIKAETRNADAAIDFGDGYDYTRINYSADIDISSLAPGNYYLKIKVTNGANSVTKVLCSSLSSTDLADRADDAGQVYRFYGSSMFHCLRYRRNYITGTGPVPAVSHKLKTIKKQRFRKEPPPWNKSAVNGEERLHVIEGDVDGDGQQNIVSGQNVPGAVQLIAVDDHQNTEQQIQDGQQTAFPLVAFFHDRLQESLLFLRLEVRDAGERRQPVFAVAVFQPDCGNGADDQAGLEIRHDYPQMKAIAEGFGFNRIVYLGSNALKGVAQESALKMLELTAGRVVTMYDTPMGFRHGPKSIVNDETLTVVYLSDFAYTRRYELDLIKEMAGQRKGNKILAVCNTPSAEAEKLADYYYCFNEPAKDSIWNGLDFILCAQLIAIYKSLSLNITPDNPCPTGEVNRVVKGVTLYPYSRS